MSIGMASPEEIEREKQARRLRELFKGRFSDAESRQLLADKGGLSDAVDFVLNGVPDGWARRVPATDAKA
nr:hypothetical protein BaRGS_028685 [Batillaria attramentaria]